MPYGFKQKSHNFDLISVLKLKFSHNIAYHEIIDNGKEISL